MKLYYYKSKQNNFGDVLNPWFWDNALSKPIRNLASENHTFVGIGTLINDGLPRNTHLHILGSGAGYESVAIPKAGKNWSVEFVRGPLTAKAIGVSERFAIADPAILVPNFLPKENFSVFKTSLIPHVGIDSARLKSVCERAGINYISPSLEREPFIDAITSSEKVICSAMHGAIICDTYRVPWLPVITSKEILAFKWNDWCQSVSLEYKPSLVPTIWPQQSSNALSRIKSYVKEQQAISVLKKLSTCRNFLLSSETLLVDKRTQLLDFIGEFENKITCVEY